MIDKTVNTPLTPPERPEEEQDWSQDIEEGSVDTEDDVSDFDHDPDAVAN